MIKNSKPAWARYHLKKKKKTKTTTTKPSTRTTNIDLTMDPSP
jgi:hypothetical protein